MSFHCISNPCSCGCNKRIGSGSVKRKYNLEHFLAYYIDSKITCQSHNRTTSKPIVEKLSNTSLRRVSPSTSTTIDPKNKNEKIKRNARLRRYNIVYISVLQRRHIKNHAFMESFVTTSVLSPSKTTPNNHVGQ